MHSTLVDLQALDLLSIDGEDSKKFLQGQVSCDIDALTGSQSLSGILCNIKGRTIADFRIFEYQHSCFLHFDTGVAEIAKSVLAKYIVFSNAEIVNAERRFSRFGLIGNDAHKLLDEIFGGYPVDDGAVISIENHLLIKIPGLIPRYEIWQDLAHDGDHGEDSSAILSLKDQSLIIGNHAWELEDIKAGIAHITPAMIEQYLPEALNYDISGPIDFNKGCYTGQEIVARMFYRGTAKKRLYHLYQSHCPIGPEAINSVGYQNQQESVKNEIIKVVTTEEGDCHLLVILPTEAVANDASFYLNDQTDLLLEVRTLPYEGLQSTTLKPGK